MSISLFEPISVAVLKGTTGWTAISNELVKWVTPLILIGLTIKIIWHGYNILRGAGGKDAMVDVFFISLRAFLIFQLALVGAMYNTNVVGFFESIRTDLTNLFVPGATSSYAALDISMSQALDALNSAMSWGFENISFIPPNATGFVAIASSLFMVVCLFIYAFVSAANLLLIDFALALIFGLGPLFIACWAFEATQRFFDTWLAGVLKYTFKAVIIAAILGLGNSLLFKYTTQLATDADTLDFIATGFSALGASGVLIFLAMVAPQIAADIIGGSGVSIMSPAKGAAMAASGGGAAMKAAGNMATSGAAKSAAGGAVNAMSYGAGAVGKAMGNTSLGQKAIASTQRLSNAVSSKTEGVRTGARNFGNAVSGSGQEGMKAQMASAFKTGGNAANRRPVHTPFPKLNG